MSSSIWWKIAAVSGASAVGVAAYGAHGFKPSDPYFQKPFDNGNRFHLVHSGLIALAPLTRRPNLIGGLFTAGTAAFCGSCYAVALAEDKSMSKFAPFGGTTLIVAWLALATL
mmetsp:Transcript_33091/g.45867  ORF Transcript_33091/g.45867 Transcript_33091/m.45867 type:complete len:113 (+) Transcript_33091:195-533(+)